MNVVEPSAVIEKDRGFGWENISVVLALLGLLLGGSGAPVLVLGLLAVVCGCIGLRSSLEAVKPPRYKWTAIGGIALGGFLVMRSLDTMDSNNVIAKAKKVNALATATALEQAIHSIYTEYGKLPDVGSRVTTNSPEGVRLLNTLLAVDANSDKTVNPGAIRFLTVREGKNHKNGLIYLADGKTVEGLYDPWGSPYTVVLDSEYKEKLHFAVGPANLDLKGRRCAAFSPGPDKEVGTADDVITW